ncbi:Cytoskeleton-associated protein 5 [Trichinella pseudospiralis]|uniref:Cytoskeleton-associated protein 5 n=1 Tax=Trichinella pseudospiralis TaxID=6337 RepID=A0A0V1J909_TRIPS|nr:Cytoskeleton-associated protein 5 [Trichinella pseudospiralis]KRZ43089.1 Cytoskeleton-associated protein 5 [Trichinella pseudospiralis]
MGIVRNYLEENGLKENGLEQSDLYDLQQNGFDHVYLKNFAMIVTKVHKESRQKVESASATTNIFNKLPPDFMVLIESSDRNERQKALEILLQQLQITPILDGNAQYGSLISILDEQMCKGSNNSIVVLAANCMKYLVRGLKKRIVRYSSQAKSALLKLKVKKSVVSSAMVELVETLLEICGFEVLATNIHNALSSKYPPVQLHTALILSRFFAHLEPFMFSNQQIKEALQYLFSIANSRDSDTRDAGMKALGIALAVGGEQTLEVSVGSNNIDKMKLLRIREHANAFLASINEENKESVQIEEEKPVQVAVEQKEVRIIKSTSDDLENLEIQNAESNEKAFSKEMTKNVIVETRNQIAEQQQVETTTSSDVVSSNVISGVFLNTESDMIKQLAEEFRRIVSVSLFSRLFHKDLAERVKGLVALYESCVKNETAAFSSSDLFFKYCVWNIYSNSESLFYQVLQFIQFLVQFHIDCSQKLQFEDICSAIPHILWLFGREDEEIRKNVRKLMRQIYSVSSPYQIFFEIVNKLKYATGIEKAEYIYQIRILIPAWAYGKSDAAVQAFYMLAECLNDSDERIRNFALRTIVDIYLEKSDSLCSLITLTESQKQLVDCAIRHYKSLSTWEHIAMLCEEERAFQ